MELKSIVPLIGAVLGGPTELAAGAISLVNNTLGISRDSSLDDIVKEIQTNQEATIKLKELENNYQQYFISVRLQMDQAEYADRASARSREVDIAKATGKMDWYLPALGGFVVLAFTTFLCILIFSPIYKVGDQEQQSASNKQNLVNILVGTLAAGFSNVLGYYFGSSAGSRNKDQSIAYLSSNSSESPATSPQPVTLPQSATPPQPAPQSVPRRSWRDE